MKKYLRILVVCGTLMSIVSCREDKKDIVTRHPIRGMVFNNCTDSGLAGVKVFLQTFKDDKSLVQQRETVSGEGGKFEFAEAEIHSNDRYNYALHIESRSGTAAQTPEYAGFDGTTMYFFRDEIGQELQLRVSPRYLFFTTVFLKQSVASKNDSILVNYSQHTFHKNVPALPYSLYAKCRGTQIHQSGTLGGFPMGKWSITIDKWVHGSHEILYDNIYIGSADTKTYTVNW